MKKKGTKDQTAREKYREREREERERRKRERESEKQARRGGNRAASLARPAFIGSIEKVFQEKTY